MVGRRPRCAVVLGVMAAIGAAAASSAPVDAGVLRVYLLGGQSNANGRAPNSGLPTSPVNLQQPQPDVPFYYGTALTTLRPGSNGSFFGPEVTMGRGLADFYAADPDTTVAIVKYAVGATNLAVDWKPGGDGTTAGDGTHYVNFQNTVAAGLAALASAFPADTIVIVGMAWMQGEADAANTAFAPAYEANLTAFIADVRATYGADLPFVLGRLASTQTAINATGLATVRAAQDAVGGADPLTFVVDTDSFGVQGDNLHFDAAGQQSLGYAFAGEFAAIATIPAPGAMPAGLVMLGAVMMRRRGTLRLRRGGPSLRAHHACRRRGDIHHRRSLRFWSVVLGLAARPTLRNST